jgi:hypothetical protein
MMSEDSKEIAEAIKPGRGVVSSFTFFERSTNSGHIDDARMRAESAKAAAD